LKLKEGDSVMIYPDPTGPLRIMITDPILVTVNGFQNKQVSLKFEAQESLRIDRTNVYERVKNELGRKA